MNAVLELDALRVAYGSGADVVRGIDLVLREGETFGLVGESGCGKSTVALAVQRYLAGAGRITAGCITVAGTVVNDLAEPQLRALRGRVMAMVYQDPVSALNPAMRLGRQLEEAVHAHRTLSRGDAHAEILQMLSRVRLPDPPALLSRWPHQLSGGQLQRVVIAMALLARPRLLILDEPTSGLDVTVEAEVAALISDIARDAGDMAILYISHDLGLIARVADRVGVMYAGQLVEEGSVRLVLKEPVHPYTRALMACIPGGAGRDPNTRLAAIPGQVPRPENLPAGCSFAPRCASAKTGLCDVGPDVSMEAVDGDDGHLARCRRLGALSDPETDPQIVRETSQGSMSPLLDVADLTRSFRGPSWLGAAKPKTVRAADGVSFSVARGEVVAMVGESGSGKSTIARILIGLDQADGGTAHCLGYDVAHLPAQRRSQALIRAVRIIFQNPDSTLNPAHRVGRILDRALKRAGKAHGQEQVEQLLSLVRLPPEAARLYPGALSGGQRQRVAIARAFAGETELIIADEPVSALDVSVQAAIVELLRDTRAQRDNSILFISHDLSLVRHISDRVIVLYRGAVMETGRTADVFAGPSHPYTEALLAAVHPPDPDYRPHLLNVPEISGPPAPQGCPFEPRCHRRINLCRTAPPPARDAGNGHRIRCHHDIAHLHTVPRQPTGEPSDA